MSSDGRASVRSLEPGKEHALGDVRLIELVTNLPLERCREHDATERSGGLEPLVGRADALDMNENAAN